MNKKYSLAPFKNDILVILLYINLKIITIINIKFVYKFNIFHQSLN